MQNLQDFFSNTMGVASLIIDKNGPITQPSNLSDFCYKYTRGSELGNKLCYDYESKGAEAAAKQDGVLIYTCYAGITVFAVPIRIEGRHLATMLGGQLLAESPDEEKFRELARKLNINEDEYIKAVKKLKVMSMEKITAAAQFLYELTNSISDIAYANLKLAEFGLDYKLTKAIKIEDFFSFNCKNLKNALSDREFEVLNLIVLGKNNTEISKDLFISVHTAKKHVSSILQKLFVEDRVQVAVKAVREKLI